MSTCGQCEFYLTKMDECPHREKRALDKACDKLQYTNPRKRIDYLQIKELFNRERIKNLVEAVGLLNSMILAGEKHSDKSRVIVEKALKA